jgi:sugar/nucleoside kinase (ribokinase family)
VENSDGKVDLVVVGNLLIDELPGSVIEPGGAALYSALAAVQLGVRVGLHSVVGQDYPLESLRESGVKLNLQKLNGPGGRTVIRYHEDGRRLTHVGPGHQVMTPQKPHPFRTRLVLLAPMPWEWQLYHLDSCEPETAFLDPYPTLNESRWNDLQTRLDKLRYLVLNREEMEMDLALIPEHVPVLLKEGAEGGVCRATGTRWEAEKVEALDPTGAGDSFVAGVAAGLVQGLSWEECLQQGAGVAARVIQQVGARALY